MPDISIFSAAWRLVGLFIILKVAMLSWELSFFLPRMPRRGNNSLLPRIMPDEKKSFRSNMAYDVLGTYLETGHSIAVDAHFLLRYQDQIFNNLHLVFQNEGGNLLISEGVMDELDNLRLKPDTGFAANTLLQSISDAKRIYSSRIEVLTIDESQLLAFGIDPKSKVERELAPYVLVHHYRLSNVVLFSQDSERRNRGTRLGLSLHSE